jgi:predicted nucleotidyltransferase
MTDNSLTQRDIATIYAIFRKYPAVRQVYLFGSRAKGDHQPGSDVDLAIMNDGVDGDVVRKIKGELEESSLPYMVDVVNYSTLEHKELKAHIDGVGVEFYRKG